MLDLEVKALTAAPLPSDATGIIDELRALEELKCAAEARQARLANALDHIRQTELAERSRLDASPPPVAPHLEVALARRISPHRGRQALSLARYLAKDLPHTKAAFDTGRISEWRATLIARETSCLEREHRATVDELVAADAEALSARGDREIVATCRREAARLDAAAVAARRRRAESERRVSIRPAPDAMVYLTALLPVAQGVGVFAALKAAADRAVGVGEATSVGNAMADELVRRATGRDNVSAQPVAVRLTMSADALLGHADDPAFLDDYGPIPAEAARALVADNLDAGLKVWLKRLFVRPEAGALISMDSKGRYFPKALAEFIELRDRWCRNSYCGAPIRNLDHVTPHSQGGATSVENGQGLCADCNQSKEAAGFSSRTVPGDRHSVELVTPTGHSYQTGPPAA
ncbi:HNH endonuclease [Nocardioides marmorisolisilvae]|uniref:HNH endonuclease n=1 Tax=Nocardioides marmorisolisilvae TaxID=1542737 RepID=A0A3N0E0R4_9ACTN|nr:HNH endonuclease signature motif containing protein [Nocardioides marmorisolisilvae]RNL81376.1 HNH endonuclease [Nocardioides marmorisolisilvae]